LTSLSKERIDELLRFDDDIIRVLLFLEVLGRARKDFTGFIHKTFGETWEFRILKALLTHGPMTKSELSFVLFGTKGKHYKLSRPNPVCYAFNRLLECRIISRKENLYDIDRELRLVLEELIR
jgi:hypothetical protein